MLNNTTFTNAANSTNGTGAGPGPRPSPFPQVDVVAMVFFCILALMIVFGNSLVIGAFRVNRRLRTTTNLLLMSLAIADLLIGTVSVPLWVYISVTYTFRGPLYDFYMIFDVICGVSSIINLTAISLERCYALIHPIKHRNIRKRSVVAIIVVAWILSSLAGSMGKLLPKEQAQYLGIIVTVAFFFVPLMVILVAYGTIFHIARAHARGRGVSSFKKDLRIATTVAVVIGLFVICWTPFFGMNFAFSVCIATNFKEVGCAGLMTLPNWIFSVSKWLQYGNSVCNPVIYGFRNKDFRRAFRKILLGLCCKKVRLSDYSKSAYGRTVRSAYLRRESSFENSRSVIFPPNVPLGMFDMRDSYRKAIQSGRSKPIKLKFTPKKSVANGLLSINVDAFRSSNEFTSSTSVWNSSSEASVSPAELCNPAFEEDDQTDICPIDQAIPVRDSNDNISSESTNSMYKSSSKGSVHSDQAYVRFSDSKTKEKDSEPKTVANLGSALDRKRSLSEIFLRTTSAKDSLKRKLRSSFS